MPSWANAARRAVQVGTRIWGKAVAVLALTVGWLAIPTAGSGQVPLPEVSAAGTDGSDSQTIDCRGNPDDTEPVPGSFVLTRDGDLTDPLEVQVTYAPSDLGLPAPVVIPAGQAAVTVEVPPVATVAVSIIPAAGYTVATDSQSFRVDLRLSVGDLGCNLGYVPKVVQVVGRDDLPPALDLPALGIDASRVAELQIEGDQPPGLELQPDGTWRGTAIELGVSDFRAYFCGSPRWCPNELQVVVVVTEDPPPAPPAAPPANPTPGTPRLTG